MYKSGWLAALAVVACAEPQGLHDTPARAGALALGAYDVDRDAERAALRDADLAHAAAASGGTAGFLASLTDDAVFLFPNAAWVEGTSDIEAVLDAPPPPFVAGMTLTWSPAFVDISSDAEVGYTFGNVVVTRPGRTSLPGQYIAFWRKGGDGTWAVEAWNMSPAFAPPGELPPQFGQPLSNGRGPFTPVDQEAEAVALRAVDAAFSAASVSLGTAEAFGMFADQHAIVLAGGDPDFIIGRNAIVESRQGPGPTLSWVPRRSGVGPLGDLGWSMGEYTVTGEAGTGVGKYLSVWRKQADGEWKFVQDAGSGNPLPVQ
jgi:ketosteroid isomerase-like protein